MHVHAVSTVLLCLYNLSKFTTMANYHNYMPKFKWDSKEKLVKLENFKTDATILFDGPYQKMEDNEIASLVLNWLGRQATQIIKSQGIVPSKPKDMHDALEKKLRQESNDTTTKLRFHSMKQKQGQSVDAYLTNLRLVIPVCNYH